MAVILVKSDVDETILMNERVEPVHLESQLSSTQFLERLVMAIEEAELRRKAHPPQLRSKPRGDTEVTRTEMRRFNRLLG